MVHIRAYAHRANTTKPSQPLPADRLSAHVERVRANSSGGVWALIDETFSVVLNYPQHVGGTTGEFPQEVDAAVQLLSQRPRAEWRTVCEIGMNAGSSAVIWLHGTDAQLHEFDMFERTYSHGTQGFLEALFPARATFHAGYSQRTVPEYLREVQVGAAPPCDLWYVDGNHDVPGVYEDFRHALATAAFDGWIMADDYSLRYPGVRRAWKEFTKRGLVIPTDTYMTKEQLPGGVGYKGWAIGRWNSTALAAINHRLVPNCSAHAVWCEYE